MGWVGGFRGGGGRGERWRGGWRKRGWGGGWVVFGDVFVVLGAVRRRCGMRLVVRCFHLEIFLPEVARMGLEVVDVLRLESRMVELVMESLRRRRGVLGWESWIFRGDCGWRRGVWVVSLGSHLGEFAKSRIEFAGGLWADGM